jgi:16S rRNA (guanine966-N2)-methyltransferase
LDAVPLRVIGGELGGRVLRGPPRSGVRPTTDRVREALFEILTARGAPMRRVLDLYSGTGAMGIEALSRGAAYCDFVESDSKACEVIRENLRSTGLRERSKLWPMTVAKAISRLAEGNRAGGQSGKRGRDHEPRPEGQGLMADEVLVDDERLTPHPNPLPSRGEETKGYDLVLADPPYEYDRAEAELASVVEQGLLAEDGIVVVEHSSRREWPETLGGLTQLTSRRYGDTRVTLYGG